MRHLSFGRISAVEFEEFCFDLLHALRFINIDWRKGTPLKTSPADSGRDIVAHEERVEVDGVAIVSDIQGNRRAFQAVLADVRQVALDLVLYGGDLAAGGADSCPSTSNAPGISSPLAVARRTISIA